MALLFQGCGIDGADVLTLGVLQRIIGAGWFVVVVVMVFVVAVVVHPRIWILWNH